MNRSLVRRKNGTGCITPSGYLRLTINGSYQFEHRLIWEKHHKRNFPRGYEIHHVDGDRLNNSIGNLQLITRRIHTRIHRGWKRVNGKWERYCPDCGKFKPLNDYEIAKEGYPRYVCKLCMLKRQARWRKLNPEKMRLYHARYYNANKEKLSAQKKIYCELHREQISKRKQNYYKTHREEILQHERERYKKSKSQ